MVMVNRRQWRVRRDHAKAAESNGEWGREVWGPPKIQQRIENEKKGRRGRRRKKEKKEKKKRKEKEKKKKKGKKKKKRKGKKKKKMKEIVQT